MSGRRVFLDVGGHLGETLTEAMKPEWRFDQIWSFEPVARCVQALEAWADERVTIVPAGWWSSDAEMDVHNPGALNASVEPVEGEVERCRFIDASAWMAEHIDATDHVWMKLNIEASELAVLGRLLDTGQISKVDHLMVYFDVEWFGRHAEAEAMRQRLNDAHVPWREATRVMFGRTQEAKTATWLAWTEGQSVRFARRMVEHRARQLVWHVRRGVRRVRARE